MVSSEGDRNRPNTSGEGMCRPPAPREPGSEAGPGQTPEEGMFDERLRPLAEFARSAARRQHASAVGLYVIQSGQVVADWRWGTGTGDGGHEPVRLDSRFNVYSVRKAYIGLAAAIAVDEGKLPGLDDPVAPLTAADPDYRGVSPRLTLRHLVTHTHGLEERRGRIVHAFQPGEGWMYNNVGVELLCRLVDRAMGWSVAEVVRDRVLQPLGLVDTGWEAEANPRLVRDVHPFGRPRQLTLGPANGHDRNLYVTPGDLARFAWLHLKRGTVDGAEILPERVIRRVTSLCTPEGIDPEWPRHGFFWWLRRPYAARTEIGSEVPEDSYQIAGMNGSLCLVMPALDAVVVRTTNRMLVPPGYNRFQEFLDLGALAVRCLSR